MNHTKPVYTAIVLDTGVDNDLSSPLLQDRPLVQERLPTFHYKACNFISGAMFGIASSVLGFRLLVQYIGGMTRMQVNCFSVGWSLLTSFLAFVLFCCSKPLMNHRMRYLTREERETFSLVMEYYAALGVFLGFCAACTATDIIYGLPWTSILITILLSIFWASVMMWCSTLQTVFDAEGAVVPKQRTATVLPLVLV